MHKTNDHQRHRSLEGRRWFATRTILRWVTLCGMATLVPTLAVAAGLIPGAYPLSSGTELDIKKDSVINGNPISKGKTGADSVVHIDGTRSTVSQTLPPLDLQTFPANASNTKATEADSPFISSTAIFFKKINVAKNQSVTFSGGGPFHIKTLDVKKEATLNFAAGTYFIDTLKIDKNSVLNVTSVPVILHIGNKADVKKDVVINPGGTVPGLRVYVHANAKFKGAKNLVFTGLIYGPATKKVDLKKNTVFHGAIITGGKITIDKDAILTYTAADQAAVSAIDTADTGGESNTAPIAHAGFNHSVEVNDIIELNGSASSDVDGDALTFAWTLESQPVGSSATLTNATSVLPTLTIDEPGDYVVQLIVNDGADDSDPDTVTLSTGNLAPVADAGHDQTIAVTQLAFLDGTGSTDANGDGLTYQWTLTNQPANSTATLDDPASATPSFTVDQPGTYTVTLLVSDGLLPSEADLAIIATDNSAPVADAGPDHDVRPGTTVTLDGTGSNDVDGNPLTYQWSQTVVPPGNTANISDPTAAAPTLTPDVEGEYVAQLQVNDGTATSKPDTALIRVGNTAPIADAGPDQSVGINTTVQLDGTNSSDPQGDPLTFQWTLTPPTGSAATLSDAIIAQPTFETDVEGTYTATLIVNDGDLDSDPDNIAILAMTPASTIASFSPTTASIGELITLTGTHFVSSSGEVGQVTLIRQGSGTIPATVTSSAPSTLTFVVPSGAATGLISLMVGGDTTTSANPLTIVPSHTFDLVVEPSTVDVQQGQTVTVAIKATSTSGLTQLANLAVTGLPSGVTGVFQPPQITAGQTVILTLTASSTQALGSTPFDVTATANIEGLEVVKTGTSTLTVQPLTTSFLGRTVVADTRQAPLAGVTVTLLGQDGSGNATGCTGQTVSDAVGNFSFTDLPATCDGGQLIRYDGSTATSPAGVYAGVDKFYTLTLDQATTPPVLVHLPRIDTAETVMVQQNATVDQTLTFPTIPHLSLTVFAGTIFTLEDGTQPNPFPLTAVDIPTDRLPGGTMPTDLQRVVPFLVGFQPANTSVNQPVPVLFPNLLNTPAGTMIPLLTLDPTQGIMVNYGTGTISDDGIHIIPDIDPTTGRPFGLTHLGWHGPITTPPQENPSPDDDHPECADPIDLSSGVLIIRNTDLEIRGGRGRIGIDRFVRSLFTPGSRGPFGPGTTHNYDYRLDTSSPETSTVVNLITPEGNAFPFIKQANGTLINTTIPTVRGAVMSFTGNNEVDLRWKDGTVYHFSPSFQALLGSVLNSITDRNGNHTTLVRNFGNPVRLTEIIDPVGRKIQLTYDSQDRITSIEDPIGRTVQYTYNSGAMLETVTDPEGGVTRYDYDTQNRLTIITDARGIVVAQNTYDANGRVIQQIQADGGVWTFDYELLNPLVALSPVQATTVTDPRGNPATFRFSPQGFVLSRTDEFGQTTEFEKENGSNLEVSRTDSLGRKTSFTYDDIGNRTSITDSEGNVTMFEFEPIFNLPIKITDALGNLSTMTYDVQGNLLTSTNPLNQTTVLTYNEFGEVTSSTDPLSNITLFSYNGQGDNISETDPLGNSEQREYDGVSRLMKLTDARGFSHNFLYDGLDRVTQLTDPKSGVVNFNYDQNSNILTIIDAKGQQTTSTYDIRNRLATRSDALGRQESFTYDSNDNVVIFIDRKNQVITYTYDSLDRRISVTYDDGSNSEFSYDAVSNVIQIVDSISGTIEYTYDNLDRFIKEKTPQGNLVYTYDAIGRRQTLTLNGQTPVNYDYDEASQLTQVAQGLQSVDLGYDSVGRRTSLIYPNGTNATFTYDEASRLKDLVHQGPAGIIEHLTYDYDAAGNRITFNRANGVASRLPIEIDAAYDAANQQIQFNSATPNLTYDANGNLEAQTIESDITSFTWNVRNQLTAVNGPGFSASHTYDALGRRVSKMLNGALTTFHYDDEEIVAEIKEGAIEAQYLNGLNADEKFVRQSNSGIEYYHADANGSVLALTDAGGAVETHYDYDPFGKTTITGSSTNPFQYTGRENDGTGIYYYRARYYSPTLQRFISEDPIGIRGGDLNLYAYVANNPVNFNDPEGLTKGGKQNQKGDSDLEKKAKEIAKDKKTDRKTKEKKLKELRDEAKKSKKSAKDIRSLQRITKLLKDGRIIALIIAILTGG